MNVSYTVTFKGFPEKFNAALEKMLRDDIAFYPKRMSMESATVEEQKSVKKAAAKKKPAKKTAPRGKSNAAA